MTTTLQTHATGTYADLVAGRAELGTSLYGDRHLARLDLLTEHLRETAACAVLLDLEANRWQLRCPHLRAAHGDALGGLRHRVHGFGYTSEVACRALKGGFVPFPAFYDQTMADVAAREGGAFAAGENLSDALEHLADAQIMALLEADRRQRCNRSSRPDAHGRLPHEVLEDLVGQLERIGLDLVALRDATT